jgi:hypothetical protein
MTVKSSKQMGVSKLRVRLAISEQMSDGVKSPNGARSPLRFTAKSDAQMADKGLNP